MKVKVYVKLKDTVLDPQGEAILQSAKRNGYDFIEDVRVGKVFELEVSDTDNLEGKVKQLCDKLLANPIIEEYSIKMGE
ncbi:MAG: phosphoribosylformylglycinamidine synthase subunit PurS [Deferribacterales bacterium]|jgi:phosphoribosylformylglycinamidine synthase|uniref:phosphoribosylformylglycinamidine synthase subunit PurS n=1 Tax=Deferrivibrio essentukiensis TaxID=2880922 RepID=UPI001987FA02|nr:phosphoribosylformylglycinamidine synthase subunit PurS [Deferrivibrio essentukiensis]MBC7197233.1 phosphoribosylformylglycinamidine synthase subunit PurS [Deferribacterales bacterium]MBZ4672029.1 purS [Deferribacteraceae bacterium]MCB4205029.1 phosphoribosylformylglycinamidine synthase subunit PurS [Deferrivibrio essentukiensis]